MKRVRWVKRAFWSLSSALAVPKPVLHKKYLTACSVKCFVFYSGVCRQVVCKNCKYSLMGRALYSVFNETVKLCSFSTKTFCDFHTCERLVKCSPKVMLNLIIWIIHRYYDYVQEINTVIEAGNYMRFRRESSEKPARRQNKTLIWAISF